MLRRLGLGALAVLLLAGTLEIHPADEAANPLGAPELYFPGAAHPEQPAHIETSAAVERPHCPACLNRVQGGAAGLPSPLEQAAPLRLGRLRTASSSLPFQVARGSVRGRAPPHS
jgi:hypothetical protein